jgi:hypothetical protein
MNLDGTNHRVLGDTVSLLLAVLVVQIDAHRIGKIPSKLRETRA